MRRFTWTLAFIAIPTIAGAHPGDHSGMGIGAGLVHAMSEHWGWLCVVALAAVVYAIGASLQHSGKDRAKRPPIR